MTLSNGDPVKEMFLLPKEERIRLIRADRWIGYTRARVALCRMEALISWPRKQRMPNLLLIGPTNNGKSMIVEKFRRGRTIVSAQDTEKERIPVVVVQTPSEPSVARFYAMLLATLGAPIRPNAKIAEVEQLTLKLLRMVEAEMLIIDELHNVLAGKSDARREFLNLLRFLGNELRIPIVGLGTRDAYLAIRSDDQLENRFEPLPLPVWEEGGELLSLLASFAATLPLKYPSQIATIDLCLADYPNTGILLPWRLTLVLSCPEHRLMLEPARINAGAVYWLNETAEEAPDLVHSLDSRIWSSATLGHVELPGGKVAADVWFRLMQTINEELSRRLYGSWNNTKLIQEVWAAADCCPRAGTIFWKSFESLSPHRRRSMLIATAIDMIERGSISPLGVDARFFCPRL